MFSHVTFAESGEDARRLDREADLFLADLTAQRPAILSRAENVGGEAWPDTSEVAYPKPAPAVPPPRTEIAAQPSLQFVLPTNRPPPQARWTIHQNEAVFSGVLDAQGFTGPIAGPSARFDPSLPFYVHVDGCVCSIVSGAQLLAREPGVEYGGQFVDWSQADDEDVRKRDGFWLAYGKARTIRGPLDVFRFIQHDHVMRRPVRLLTRHIRAVFEVKPLAVRVGPIVRYVDRQRAVIWFELETPGLVRITYGKATNQRELPIGDAPAAQNQRYTASVRVGGRHYALVCLDQLEADTVYQYGVTLAPQPPTGRLPIDQADFTEAVFPAAPRYGGGPNAVVREVAFKSSRWLFFRTFPASFQAFKFAHGSCRKWPGDKGVPPPLDVGKACRQWAGDPNEKILEPSPDMLEAFGEWLAGKQWADWPRFFLHTGDQIYADDVGVAKGGALVRHRFASAVPGPVGGGPADIAFGAWAGRFGGRYGPLGAAAPPPPAQLDTLCGLRPRVTHHNFHDIDYALTLAVRARKQAAFARTRSPLPVALKLRVLNELLWEVPDEADQVPHVSRQTGLMAPQVYAEGTPAREFRVQHPSAGDTGGIHAADFSEYAALYEQAWITPNTRRVLAHLPSFMIFDDHEVTDDWNADRGWLNIIHTAKDPLRFWPHTITDALCAYWMYQGWGNLSPEQWAGDPRVQILERCQKIGSDALPELRRLIGKRAVDVTAPETIEKTPSSPRAWLNKLNWHFSVPTGDVPFLTIDLRTDRDVNGTGGMSKERVDWLGRVLTRTQSPLAILVLPVPFLMPDPMLFAFRHPGFTARLAGARSTTAFRRGSDIEHPADNPVWDQIKGLIQRLQQGSTLKTVVLISGDVHFSCNLDGQLKGSNKPPRLLQLISSGLQQQITDAKQGKLFSAYRGWLNTIARSQGVDEHRGVRITLGGLRAPDKKRQNFLFKTSLALVDVDQVSYGQAGTRTPQIVQRHLTFEPQPMRHFAEYAFLHRTHPDGKATMTVHDPGFAGGDPRDYPRPTDPVASTAAIEIAAQPYRITAEAETDGAEDKRSLEPGQSLLVDGQQVRTYVDLVAWYTARRNVLATYQSAFTKEAQSLPPGVADAIAAADANVKEVRPLGTAPIGDRHVEGMLDWFDRFRAAVLSCERRSEEIAEDRFRAAKRQMEDLKDQFARMTPQIRELQRSAFRDDNTSKLKEAAETFATYLDSVLVADEWVLDAATKMEDIKVLGTTLRTQKALHGSTTPWNDLMRKTTNQRIAKLVSVAQELNKVLAAWQLVDASIAVLAGGKTASDRASAGINLAATAASAGGTLLGASGFFSLYTNFYIGPMVKRILGQIDVLKDKISTGINRPWIQLGKLDYVNWDIEPGGRSMYEFMRGVMKVRESSEIKIPNDVSKYFAKHRKAFDAGTPKVRGRDRDYNDFDDKRVWVFLFRDDIWGMLYGSMPVP
jgi:hypothetical protein